MVLVQTKIGLVDRAQLEVRDIVWEDENGRYVATEWRLVGETSWDLDKLVKRDGWASMYRGVSTGVTQGTAGG